MTDEEMLQRVVGALASGPVELSGFRKGGRLLLGIPRQPEAAGRTLGLYQPQRPAARIMTGVFRFLAERGFHHRFLPKLSVPPSSARVIPELAGIEPSTRGVLLGSPEHKVRRAVATYRNDGDWEVAKIALGDEGYAILNSEARALGEIHSLTAAAPRLLGLHRIEDLTLMRMPYLSGMPLDPGEISGVLGLLDSWKRDLPRQRADQFDEWPAIERALAASDEGRSLVQELKPLILQPMIRHGDFARWNLLRKPDGSITALDWEWGHPAAMPGLDLIHYFLQDQRLVRRLPHEEAITTTLKRMRQTDSFTLFRQTGWPDDPMLPVIASLAYKQGSGHQENTDILNVAVARFRWNRRRKDEE